MDRERFEHLLAAYGADSRRWPANERAAAAVFAAEQGGLVATALADAASIDAALDAGREAPAMSAGLMAQVLAAAPKRRGHEVDGRALWALAACAVFGVVLGYGGGQLAAPAPADEDYFAAAFESPFDEPGDGG